MATDKKVTGDLGSNLVEEMRLQLNRLTTFVVAIKVAIDANPVLGNDLAAALALIDGEGDFTNIVLKTAAPRVPSL